MQLLRSCASESHDEHKALYFTRGSCFKSLFLVFEPSKCSDFSFGKYSINSVLNDWIKESDCRKSPFIHSLLLSDRMRVLKRTCEAEQRSKEAQKTVI